MAACLISVTGTQGQLRLDYKIGSTPFSIQTSIGTFYIDDTATDVTYTTLTGDLIASSLCLTITEVPTSCYELFWTGIDSPGYTVEKLLLGPIEINITDVDFPNSSISLANSINSSEIEDVKVIAYAIYTSPFDGPTSFRLSYILKVIGDYTPILKVKNADDTVGYIYIYGEPTSCTIPVGYTQTDPCYPYFPTTTTTTAAL